MQAELGLNRVCDLKGSQQVNIRKSGTFLYRKSTDDTLVEKHQRDSQPKSYQVMMTILDV